MKKLIGVFVMLAMSWSVAGAATVTLQANSIVVVKTTGELSSKKITTGQPLTGLVVAMPVKVNDQILIQAGTPVIGEVQTAEEAGMVGQAGELVVAVQMTTAVDGQNIGLTGALRSKGDSEVGGTVAVSVLLCPLALLNKGDEGVIPVGAQVRAMTLGQYKINLAD